MRARQGRAREDDQGDVVAAMAGSPAMMPVGQDLAGPAASPLGAAGPAASPLGAGQVLLAAGAASLVVCAALLAVPAVRGLVRADAAGPGTAATPGPVRPDTG
ncbi:hypothetical protein ACH49_25880 [Streptomyces leeuwenhoekii]|uniref:Uncharacterized protein n=1 Tax=Streptomyces leeuwenhoekii TaxID=1437453 RepID=A0ABR5HSX9_STRLW|nr:hypothetical protein ACH49_25880 [Streptomyces leeuwenhoekii]